MKTIARNLIAAQCTVGAASLASWPCDLSSLFDSRAPELSGSLAGESFAATLENSARYPSLHQARHAALLRRVDSLVVDHLFYISALLPGLGFDGAGISAYQKAALSAFRAAIPSNNRGH
jgi:hypothetical protein